jgi:hypothetical protein
MSPEFGGEKRADDPTTGQIPRGSMGYSPKVCELLDQVYQLKLDVAFHKGATDAEPVPRASASLA